MRFDHDYHEHAEVGGGLKVILRLLVPGDREQLREGFYRLSETGRYRRFLSAKNRLSEAELDYLTQVDQVRHVALVAVTDDPSAAGGEGPGLAVARFICYRDRPSVAEPAITVLDEAQRRGLGRLLFTRLIDAAKERGVRRFRGELLAANRAALGLIESIVGETDPQIEQGVTVVEFDLPDVEPDAPPVEESPAYKLFKLIAERTLALRRFLAWPGDDEEE